MCWSPVCLYLLHGFYLIALFFWCLLAIFIFDQTETDLRTAQPVTMDDIHD